MKILNLYACLGGNRYKWGNEHDITAVEWDSSLAEMYQQRFTNDKVVVADAHKYLLKHYKEYDFIWSSPPCPTHSRARFWAIGANGKKPIYPDMTLYQEIIFLNYHFKGKFVVENVIPYYQPFLNPYKKGRHLYWTNFVLPNTLNDRRFPISQSKNELKELCDFHKINLSTYKGKQSKVKIARNLVDYEAGKTILDVVLGIYQNTKNINQTKMF